MNLEQIVKETVAKMVDEKHLTAAETKKKEDIVKAMKGKGLPEPIMYAIATDKAKKLAEASIPSNVESLANKIISWYEKHPNPKMQADRLPAVEKNIEYLMSKTVGNNAWDFKTFEKAVKAKYPLVFQESQEINEDYEVAMAQDSLDSIIRAAMMLKTQMGDQEVNLPAWIQDHITNSENYINQAAKGYHESDTQITNHAGEEEMDEASESNDDKIEKYEKYTYTLDGEIVKPEITFLNNILKAILGNKIYNIGTPENNKVELTPESGKKGTYTEEMNESRVSQDNVVDYLAHALQSVWAAGKGNNSIDFQDFAQSLYFDMFGGDEMNEANLGHNEISKIEQEGRFWIVTYSTANGIKEKSFESEDEARKFYNTLDEAFVPKSSFDDYKIGDNVTVAGKKAKITNMKMDDESGERRARVKFEDGTAEEVSINTLDENTMTTNEGRSAEDLKQAQLDQAYSHLEKIKEKPKLFSSEDIKKAEARIEKLEAELDALAAKATNESLDEATVRRWQHYAGIK
jgi:hypothetical protein